MVVALLNLYRLAYPVTLLEKLLATKNADHLMIMYDISCVLKKYMQVSSNYVLVICATYNFKFLLEATTLFVNAPCLKQVLLLYFILPW